MSTTDILIIGVVIVGGYLALNYILDKGMPKQFPNFIHPILSGTKAYGDDYGYYYE